jgi:serine/threonine-protein kinase
MEVTFAQLSSVGPVRVKNEDYLGHWLPTTEEDLRERGVLAVLADGVGGQGHGEVASRLAVETALTKFVESKPGTASGQLLRQLFNAANIAVYDAGMHRREQGRMATTLLIAHFRHNEVNLGHVGDCRAYIIQEGRIRRVTTDHSYVGLQLKMGLITEAEAATSQLRSLLTRSVGKDLTVQVELHSVVVNRGDFLVQCSDGLHAYVSEQEIREIVTHHPPEEACRVLIALAEKRQTDDNLSVQVVQINRVEQVLYYRGLPVYQEGPDLTMSSELQVGQVLDDRFRIVDVITRSGMASIYKAVDLKSGRTVAVKVPSLQFECDPGFFSRFEREEAIGKALNHPYILHIIPVEEKSRPYIAMEYLEGQTLRQVLRTVQRMPEADALRIASRICEALEHMHKQDIVHRDLKPENIMVCNDGSLRVMDFGIAKAAGMRRLTFTGFSNAMGTPDYMAPEQVKGKRGDERTDIYSLGAMLYEMVTGTVPFEGANPYLVMNARLTGDPVAPRKINPDITRQAEEIILHALAQEPGDRYASAAAMKADLDAPEAVQVTGRSERLRPQIPWRSRWRQARLIVICLVAPILIFGLVYLFLRRP